MSTQEALPARREMRVGYDLRMSVTRGGVLIKPCGMSFRCIDKPQCVILPLAMAVCEKNAGGGADRDPVKALETRCIDYMQACNCAVVNIILSSGLNTLLLVYQELELCCHSFVALLQICGDA